MKMLFIIYGDKRELYAIFKDGKEYFPLTGCHGKSEVTASKAEGYLQGREAHLQGCAGCRSYGVYGRGSHALCNVF